MTQTFCEFSTEENTVLSKLYEHFFAQVEVMRVKVAIDGS